PQRHQRPLRTPDALVAQTSSPSARPAAPAARRHWSSIKLAARPNMLANRRRASWRSIVTSSPGRRARRRAGALRGAADVAHHQELLARGLGPRSRTVLHRSSPCALRRPILARRQNHLLGRRREVGGAGAMTRALVMDW